MNPAAPSLPDSERIGSHTLRTVPFMSEAPQSTRRFTLFDLLNPHWKALSLAFLAVLGVTITDLMEPWPLKLVFDYLLHSKPLPAWLNFLLRDDSNKLSLLTFAAIGVIVVAVLGAISSYAEKYLTSSVGQWVVHD